MGTAGIVSLAPWGRADLRGFADRHLDLPQARLASAVGPAGLGGKFPGSLGVEGLLAIPSQRARHHLSHCSEADAADGVSEAIHGKAARTTVNFPVTPLRARESELAVPCSARERALVVRLLYAATGGAREGEELRNRLAGAGCDPKGGAGQKPGLRALRKRFREASGKRQTLLSTK